MVGYRASLGAAIAEQLLAPGVTLLGISRGVHPQLAARAQSVGATLLQWPHDLADALPLAERLEAWLSAFDPQRFDSASLINNAALVGPVGPIDGGPREALAQALGSGGPAWPGRAAPA